MTRDPRLDPQPGSPHQEKLLRWLVTRNESCQIARHGNAHWLSAARALVRRGLADSYETGSYYATNAGKEWCRRNKAEVVTTAGEVKS